LFFQQISEAFAGYSPLTYTVIADKLRELWSIEGNTISHRIPLLAALLSGNVSTPEHLDLCDGLPTTINEDLPSFILQKPLKELPFDIEGNPQLYKLHELGIHTLGDVIIGPQNSALQNEPRAAYQSKLAKIIELLAKTTTALPCSELEFWDIFAKNAGLPLLQGTCVQTFKQFTSALEPVIRLLLKQPGFAENALSVFNLRTFKPLGDRLTIMAVAEQLGGSLPNISKSETGSLARLQSILYDRDFSRLNAQIDEVFLAHCKSIRDTYDSSNKDFETFKNGITKLSEDREPPSEKNLQLFWALASGYVYKG